MTVRTRYAPSPTGFMHVGNLRTALYEYLTAKSQGGKFILRIEDTDQERLVDGAIDIVYSTLKKAGLIHDEGPDIGGFYGPYIQSERRDNYIEYAKILVEKGAAYYCFCSRERLDELRRTDTRDITKYDRHCYGMHQDEIERRLANGESYVIRQLIPPGSTTFHDEAYGEITVENQEIEDQVLIKSDGLPTYNFANVVDDHMMAITHVVRGSEYLSSTPKYNLLYEAFGWDIPVYIHLPLVLNEQGVKISKRNGDASFEDLLKDGYLPEAIINYIALLGWSPSDNREIFSLDELTETFNTKGISKSPSMLDMKKLRWMNSEYIKKLLPDRFYEMALPFLKDSITREDIDFKKVALMCQSRVEFVHDIRGLTDFIDVLPEYDAELYVHKKMKTDKVIALTSLEKAQMFIADLTDFTNDALYKSLVQLAEGSGLKNSQILWPIRTALSGKPTSPCGATELMELLGKEESLKRIQKGIDMLK